MQDKFWGCCLIISVLGLLLVRNLNHDGFSFGSPVVGQMARRFPSSYNVNLYRQLPYMTLMCPNCQGLQSYKDAEVINLQSFRSGLKRISLRDNDVAVAGFAKSATDIATMASDVR